MSVFVFYEIETKKVLEVVAKLNHYNRPVWDRNEFKRKSFEAFQLMHGGEKSDYGCYIMDRNEADLYFDDAYKIRSYTWKDDEIVAITFECIEGESDAKYQTVEYSSEEVITTHRPPLTRG